MQALDDDFLLASARRPKTGFGLPMADRIASGFLARKRLETADPSAPVWDHVDRKAGLRLLSTRGRWSEPWSLIALNGWLSAVDTAEPSVGPNR